MPPNLHHAPAYLVTANSQHVLRLSSAAHDEESGDLVPSFVSSNDVTSMRRSVTVIVAVVVAEITLFGDLCRFPAPRIVLGWTLVRPYATTETTGETRCPAGPAGPATVDVMPPLRHVLRLGFLGTGISGGATTSNATGRPAQVPLVRRAIRVNDVTAPPMVADTARSTAVL